MADVNISSDVVQTSKLLGVVLDSNLCFADMINNACRVCFFKLINLQSIRHFLLFDTKIMLLKSFITSCFDYKCHIPPIEFCTKYKLCPTVFKSLNNIAPI